MSLNFLLSILIVATLSNESSAIKDYYWRNYYGEVPLDAVPSGLDEKGDPTYIGQVFVVDKGVLPATIYNGQKAVTPMVGVVKTTGIKILCSQYNDKFKWLPVTADTYVRDTMGWFLVPVGEEDGQILYAGRVHYQSELRLGKVRCCENGATSLVYPYKKVTRSAKKYQVLTYDDTVTSAIKYNTRM